jgi:hypothetical protein
MYLIYTHIPLAGTSFCHRLHVTMYCIEEYSARVCAAVVIISVAAISILSSSVDITTIKTLLGYCES